MTKPIDQWTRKECEEYLRQYPKSLQSDAVRERLESFKQEIEEESCEKSKPEHENQRGVPKPKLKFSNIIVILIAVLIVGCVVYNRIEKNKKQFEINKVAALAKYDEIGGFGDYGAKGLALVSKNQEGYTLYGCINEQYEEVIPCIYLSIEPFKHNQSVVVLLDKYAIIDAKGRIKKHLQGEELLSLFDTIYHWNRTDFDVVRRNGKYGIINNNKNVVIACIYDELISNNGYLTVGIYEYRGEELYAHRWGAVDKQGKLCIPVKYSSIHPFNYDYNSGLFILTDSNGKRGMMNKNGKIVIPFEYDAMSECIGADDLVWVRKGNKSGSYKYGMIDIDGRILTPVKYSETMHFNDYGLASVSCDGKYGMLDKKGNEIVPVIYDNKVDFWRDDYYTHVVKNGKYGMIDRDGTLIIPVKYDDIDGLDFSDGRMLVKRDGKYGYVDMSGKEVISCKYDYAYSFYNGEAEVEYNGREYSINIWGSRVN